MNEGEVEMNEQKEKQPMSKKKKIILGVIAAFAIIGIFGSGGDKDTEPKEITATASMSEEVVEKAEPSKHTVDTATEKPKDDENLALYMAVLQAALNQGFGDNYEIDYEDDMIIVKTWKDGVAFGVMLAQSGDQEFQNSWHTIVESLCSLAEVMHKELENFNLTNKHISIHLLNDLDKEKVLLSVLDGEVFYDAVNGR